MLKNSYLSIVIAALVLLFGSCGHGDRFVIEGQFEGEAPQSVRALFYAEGALHNVPVTVNDGKFRVEGRSPQPVIIDIYLPDRTRVATLVAQNGETLELTLNKDKPLSFSAKGDDTSEALSAWIKDNSSALTTGDPLAINAAIEKYVAANSDKLLSSVLLLGYYDSSIDPVAAAELFDRIDPQARPSYLVDGYSEMVGISKAAIDASVTYPIPYYVGRDSANIMEASANPYTLLAVTSANLGRDSIVSILKEWAAEPSLKVVELSIDTDSTAWRRSIAPDSAAWAQGWLPGGPMSAGVDRLSLPRLPYFILVDSTGSQLLRTPSITVVDEHLPALIR